MQMPESLKRNPMRWLLVAAFAAFAVSAFALLTSFPAAAQTAVDYDKDNDGLIEVDNIQKLDAIRWDLDGDGSVMSTAEAAYYDAFDNPLPDMGCDPEGGCDGYELTADIDFDTNRDGTVDDKDVYSGSGLGWEPIGPTFDAVFDGNGHAIRNLYINRHPSEGGAGLFDRIGNPATVKNIEFVNANLIMKTNKSNPYKNGLGVLAGRNAGTVQNIAVRSSTATITYDTETTQKAYVGGIVGYTDSTSEITNSYAASDTTISASYPAAYAGGIIGGMAAGPHGVHNTYSHATVFAPNAVAGGLIGIAEGAVRISHSYAAGWVDGQTPGGLIGVSADAKTTITESYWDIARTGNLSSAGGTGKTASDLQAMDTEADGIYENWSTDAWDFADDSHYPLLRADWNRDRVATWQEFGEQDPTPRSPPTRASRTSP